MRLTTAKEGQSTYRWNTNQLAHHFGPHCGGSTLTDCPAFQSDESWDGSTRRIGDNARRFNDFDAAAAPLHVINGKNL